MQLPKSNEHVDWSAIMCESNIGRSWTGSKTQANAAYHAAATRGYSVSARQIRKGVFEITLTGRRCAKGAIAVSPQEMSAARLRDQDFTRRLREATENLVYWRRQKALRENPLAKADAGARVLLWENEVRVLKAKLQTATA